MANCDFCSTAREYCKSCCDNPIYPKHSYFKPVQYKPFCPFGFTDCIYDPNYLSIVSPNEDIEYWKKECLKAYEAEKESNICLFYAYY